MVIHNIRRILAHSEYMLGLQHRVCVLFYTLSFPHYLHLMAWKCPGYVKVHTGKYLTLGVCRCTVKCTLWQWLMRWRCALVKFNCCLMYPRRLPPTVYSLCTIGLMTTALPILKLKYCSPLLLSVDVSGRCNCRRCYSHWPCCCCCCWHTRPPMRTASTPCQRRDILPIVGLQKTSSDRSWRPKMSVSSSLC